MIATTEQILNYASTFKKLDSERLRYCTATVESGWLYDEQNGYTYVYMLKSYNTYVAMIKVSTQRAYVFNYYSATTCQHVAKFLKDYYANDVYYLYKRSDNTGFRNIAKYGSGLRLTYKQVENNIEF